MSIYQDIESAIVARLAPFGTAGFDVVALPESNAEYSRPFVDGKITVAYHSSNYEKPQSTGHISQFEEASFIIAIQSRTLRGTKGIYNIAEIVRRYLVGFEPAGLGLQSRMYAKEFGLKEGMSEDGLFTYYGIFCIRILAVEDFTETALADGLAIVQYDNDLTGASFDTQNP